jgi:hypothetical protein
MVLSRKYVAPRTVGWTHAPTCPYSPSLFARHGLHGSARWRRIPTHPLHKENNMQKNTTSLWAGSTVAEWLQ